MGVLFLDAQGVVSRQPKAEVYIGGAYWPTAQVDVVVQSSGLDAALVDIRFPDMRRDDRPAREMDRVVVYADRWRNPAPIFIGRVTVAPVLQSGPRGGARLAVRAADLRWFLNDDFCSRGFNIPGRDGELNERLRTRAIFARIHAEYVAHQQTISGRSSSDILGLDLASVPDQDAGEFSVRGEPHGTALQKLVASLGDGSYRLRVRYASGGSAVLSCFKAGQGKQQFGVLGTDFSRDEYAQNWGVAQIGDNEEGVDSSKVVNQVVLESPNLFRETALPLGPAFAVDRIDSVLDFMEAAQIPTGPQVTNPLYDPAAQSLGRAWNIPPQVDADGVSRHLKIERELIQYRGGDPFQDGRPLGPALVYRYAPGDDWIVRTDGFAVQDDRTVVTNEPLWRLMEEGEDPVEVDRVVHLSEARIADLVNGERALILQNPIPVDDFDLGEYLGAGEVRLTPGGGGSALSVITGDPETNPFADTGTIWINPATRRIHYVVRRGIPSASSAEFFLTLGVAASGVRAYFRAEREVDAEAPSAPVLALPSEIYFQAAFRSETPLQVESAVQPGSRARVRTLSTSRDGAKHVACNWFEFSAAAWEQVAGVPVQLGQYSATLQDAGVDAWTLAGGATVFRDDSPELLAIANNMAKTAAEPRANLARKMPRMPLGYEVGSLYNENGRARGNIHGVVLDFARGDTILEVGTA